MGKATRIEVFRGNERKQIDLDLKTPVPKYADNRTDKCDRIIDYGQYCDR
jgi:hypothetical protein